MRIPPAVIYWIAKSRFWPQQIRKRLLVAALLIVASYWLIDDDGLRSDVIGAVVAAGFFAAERWIAGQEKAKATERRKDPKTNKMLRHPTIRMGPEQTAEMRRFLAERRRKK